MAFLFPRAPNVLYPQGLAAAYTAGAWWLYDPDYSLSRDPEFFEKAQRDAVIAHAMQMRQHIVAGRSWNMNPGGSAKKDKLLASVVEEALKRRLRGFTGARYQLARAVFTGSTFARIYGKREPAALVGLPTLNFWLPTEIDDVDKRRVRRRVEGGKVILEHWPVTVGEISASQWVAVERPEWIVKHTYNDDEASLGYGRGLAQSLYEYMKAKAALLVYMLQAAERFGPGLLGYKMDLGAATAGGLTPQAAAQGAVNVLRTMRGEGVIAYDSRDEITLLEGSGTGWQMITQALAYLDQKIVILLLGSNLPTQATSGGSYAMAEVQENSTEALVQYDREILSETIDRDLVGLFLAVNAPQIRALGLGGAARPRFTIIDEKRADPEVTSRVVTAVLAAGIPLRKNEVYERLGFGMPSPDDEVIDPRPAEAGMGVEIPGLGTADGLPVDTRPAAAEPEAGSEQANEKREPEPAAPAGA